MENKGIFESAWEQPEPPESEIKQILKSIRRRNGKIIAISVILAAALLLGCVNILIPAAERMYWSPTDGTIGEGISDLMLVLSAYTELFQPGWEVSHVSTSRSGFAHHELSIIRKSTVRDEYSYMTGSLNKNILGWDHRFSSEFVALDYFASGTFSFHLYPWEQSTDTADKLAELPEYVTVEAAVSFSEDMDMEQLLILREEYQLPITWVAIRNAPEKEAKYPLCGMSPFTGSTIYFEVNEKYPQFGIDTSANPGFGITDGDLEQHFKSLLQLSGDLLEQNRGAPVHGGNRNYYAEVLDYVEENGVMSYGCMVFASPSVLLRLLADERISAIRLQDAWIDV